MILPWNLHSSWTSVTSIIYISTASFQEIQNSYANKIIIKLSDWFAQLQCTTCVINITTTQHTCAAALSPHCLGWFPLEGRAHAPTSHRTGTAHLKSNRWKKKWCHRIKQNISVNAHQVLQQRSCSLTLFLTFWLHTVGNQVMTLPFFFSHQLTKQGPQPQMLFSYIEKSLLPYCFLFDFF